MYQSAIDMSCKYPANYHGNSELLSLSLFEYESPTHMLLDFYSEIFEFEKKKSLIRKS